MDSRTRGYLPHKIYPAGIYFVTFRLVDSLPASLVFQWKQKLKSACTTDVAKLNLEYQKAVQNFLDYSSGNCWLKQPNVASIMDSALTYFNHQRYHLYAWTIMPNHVHVLFELIEGNKFSSIIHSWKSYTAHQANKVLNRTGEFWQREYFETIIKSERHLEFALRYVLNNPVKAGLCTGIQNWPWTRCYDDMQSLARRFFL